MSKISNVTFFKDEQDLEGEGIFRRYEIDPNLVISHSGLIYDLNDYITNNKPFDGYEIYKAFLSFADSDAHFSSVEIEWDNYQNVKYVSALMKVIDSMDLILKMGVIWTYCDKQKGRGKLYSWKKQVLEENTVCACCGYDDHLEAHHIFNYADYPELRDDVTNGVVLCKWCHKKYHSKYPDECTPKTLIEFISNFGGRK